MFRNEQGYEMYSFWLYKQLYVDPQTGAAVFEDVNKDGQIILNIAPSAVKDLFIANEAVSFSARFSGVVNNIYVPCGAVLGIYGRENGQGMMFELETPPTPPVTPEPTKPTKSAKLVKPDVGGDTPAKKSFLKVVK